MPTIAAAPTHLPTHAENISLFVEYAQRAYRRFGSLAKYWATFNEPGGWEGAAAAAAATVAG